MTIQFLLEDQGDGWWHCATPLRCVVIDGPEVLYPPPAEARWPETFWLVWTDPPIEWNGDMTYARRWGRDHPLCWPIDPTSLALVMASSRRNGPINLSRDGGVPVYPVMGSPSRVHDAQPILGLGVKAGLRGLAAEDGRSADMAERAPVAEQAMVGEDATPWATASERLENPEAPRTNWLATVRSDGRPHLTPVIGIWLDGAFYFLTGEETRKGRDLAADPRCVVAFSSTTLPSLDLILEGEARMVTDEGKLRRLIDAYGTNMQWPLELREGGIFGENAPTAGPPPYAFFELRPTTVFGLPGLAGTEAGLQGSLSPTRWRFAEDGGHT